MYNKRYQMTKETQGILNDMAIVALETSKRK